MRFRLFSLCAKKSAHFFAPQCSAKIGGFTLVEMLVVLAIMVLVSTSLLYRYPALTESINLQKGSQIIASNLRRAQVYGLSVKEVTGGSGLFPSYGIHFDEAPATFYILFADFYPTGGNNRYNPANGELLDTYYIPSPGYVFDLCAEKEPGTDGGCTAGGSGGKCGLGGVNIIFKRPVPDIYLLDAEGSPTDYCNELEIVLRSPRGKTKTVQIWKTGQITVE